MMKDNHSKNSGGFPPKNVCGICCLLLMWLMSSSVGYTAEVGGTLNQNTVWLLANSPYHVTQDMVINSDVTLNIEAGVMVNLDNGVRIDVNGTLIARGTANQKIVFQSTSGTTPGSWDMIYFSDSSVDANLDEGGNYSSGSVLQYCVIQYGGGGEANASVELRSASPLIEHCEIQNGGHRGIYAENSNSMTRNNRIISNQPPDQNNCHAGLGIQAYQGNITIASNTISGNQAMWIGGGIRTDRGTVIIEQNTISANLAAGGGGIYTSQGTITTQQNLISRNNANSGERHGAGIQIDRVTGSTLNPSPQ